MNSIKILSANEHYGLIAPPQDNSLESLALSLNSEIFQNIKQGRRLVLFSDDRLDEAYTRRLAEGLVASGYDIEVRTTSTVSMKSDGSRESNGVEFEIMIRLER